MGEGTRIDGPRTARVRFSTGRAAVLRAVPSFTSMVRSGLIDQHDLDDVMDVISGDLPPDRLGLGLLDSILRHIFLEPHMEGSALESLDELEEREAIQWAFDAYLASQRVPLAAVEDDDEDEEALTAEPEQEPDAAGIHEESEAAILKAEAEAESGEGEAE